MKKLIALLYISLILTVSFSMSAQAGIKIWPGKLYIDINKWDQKTEEITYKIQVTNPNDYGINVTGRIDNPAVEAIDEGYSIIPDKSWVEIKPDIKYIAPDSSEYFEVVIIIPEDQKESLYNKKWDVRAVFTSDKFGAGGFNFKIELAVKLLITTPKGELSSSQYYPIIIFLIIIGGILIFVSNYLRKRSKGLNTAFYFKNKK